MPLRNFFDEGEAEAETALLPRLFVPAAIKLLEDLRRLIRRNPEPLIGHPEADGAVAVGHIDTDGGTGRTVLDGVRHKVRQRLVQKQAIRPNQHSIRIAGYDAYLFLSS